MSKDIAILDLSNAATMKMTLGYIKSRHGLHRFLCERLKDQRTLSQNAYYWAVVLKHVSEGMTEAWGETVTVDEAHEFCKNRFLSKPIVDRNTGEIHGHAARSTTSLDIAECVEYIDKVIQFAAEYLNRIVPWPSRPEQCVIITELKPEQKLLT